MQSPKKVELQCNFQRWLLQGEPSKCSSLEHPHFWLPGQEGGVWHYQASALVLVTRNSGAVDAWRSSALSCSWRIWSNGHHRSPKPLMASLALRIKTRIFLCPSRLCRAHPAHLSQPLPPLWALNCVYFIFKYATQSCAAERCFSKWQNTGW
jgi:hypothetical protein